MEDGKKRCAFSPSEMVMCTSLGHKQWEQWYVTVPRKHERPRKHEFKK
jgi:hypothetical protein